MNWKQVLLFGGIALFAFAGYALLRETIVGADSAAFIGYSCGHSPIGKDGKLVGLAAFGIPTTTWFFSALPCNQLLFKAIACLNLFLCTLILAKTGELFDNKHGWLLGLFAFMNGLFLPTLLDFEETQLGMPFLFLASYFLLKHIKNKKSWKPTWFDKDLLFGFALVLLAGLFWKGSIYFVALFGLYYLPATLIFAFALPLIWQLFFNPLFAGLQELGTGLKGGMVMQEAMVGFGFLQQWGLLLGLLNKNKFLWLAIGFTCSLSFLAMRFAWLPIPFLGVALILYLKEKPKFRQTLVILALGFLVFSVFNLARAFPDNQQVQAIKEGVALAHGEKVCNAFGTGWWVKLFGGKTDFYSGFPDCNASEWHGIVIDNNSAFVQQ